MPEADFDAMVERRMLNTGEDRTSAERAVMHAWLETVKDQGHDDQSWTSEWAMPNPGPWTPDQDAAAWIRSRPPELREIMVRFPPLCLVRGTVPLQAPRPGTLGIVVSYVAPGPLHPEGQVVVSPHPESRIRAHCEPSWLEAVGFHEGWTPMRVREVLR